MRYAVLPILAMALGLAGCGDNKEVVTAKDQATKTVNPACQQGGLVLAEVATPAKPTGRVMAMVNGKALTMDKLHAVLVSNYGLAVARQIVATELIAQAAIKNNIVVTQEDITAEEDASLARMIPDVKGVKARRAYLSQLLRQMNIARPQWDLTMKRNAILGKLAEKHVTVSAEEIKQQFGFQFGRKYVVRHIKLPNWPSAQLVLKNLADGGDFASLAKSKSINRDTAAKGGLLPPIGVNDILVHPNIRDAAIELKKPGDISPIVMAGESVHILELEEIIEPRDLDFNSVKDALAVSIRKRKVQNLRLRIGNEMLQKAFADGSIRFIDPQLNRLSELDKESRGPNK